MLCRLFFFFQAEDGIRDLVRSRGLGDVYKRQAKIRTMTADPDFRELVTFARELADGNVEGTLYRLSLIHI